MFAHLKKHVHLLQVRVHNVLKVNVPLTTAQKAHMARYKKQLRPVAQKRISEKQQKWVLQTGGFLSSTNYTLSRHTHRINNSGTFQMMEHV